MKRIALLLIIPFLLGQCRSKEPAVFKLTGDKPHVPSGIKEEHAYLLGRLEKIVVSTDSTGRTAKKLKDLLTYHFKEEEDYVFPPLGVLPLIASGQMPDSAGSIIVLTRKYTANAAKLVAEHQIIKVILNELMTVALKENHTEIEGFDKEMEHHALIEEEVFYPACVLIGKYLDKDFEKH